MRKIGGIKMGAVRELKGNLIRKYDLREALEESLKEVRLHEEGKIMLKTWDELYDELKNNKEKI